MKYSILAALAAMALQATALNIPALEAQPLSESLAKKAACSNSPTSRNCWGSFSTDSNYYTSWPNTGVTREYYLDITNSTMAPDGYERTVLSFNGSVPGPAIVANWGDHIVVHVTNSMTQNGTAIHWHGVRQLNSSEYDGVPGVTQCPISPGHTMTYKFQATQYGSSWYHSHFTLQLGDGLFGPINIHGPATANYDHDLGTVFLQDWSHLTAFQQWESVASHGGPPTLPNGLINGTNVFNCTGSTDTACVGGGKRFETTFVSGQKYLIRLVNSALDGYIRFGIDNHTFQVIANDFVPIVPYNASNIIIGIGQRYDIVVTADQATDNYWLHAAWMSACSTNTAGTASNILGIVRYNGSSTAAPTATASDTAAGYANNCQDEPYASLVPHLSQTVGSYSTEETLELSEGFNNNLFTWTINSSSLVLNWTNPTELQILNDQSPFPTDYNVQAITVVNSWVFWVIQEDGTLNLNHPIHLHGHDFFVLAQDTGTFDASTTTLKLDNPPRRDVATLPGNGFLVIAFYTDNPGSWLMHCHIAWHASQGLSMQFVERESEIAGTIKNSTGFKDQCSVWSSFYATEQWKEDDSGI